MPQTPIAFLFPGQGSQAVGMLKVRPIPGAVECIASLLVVVWYDEGDPFSISRHQKYVEHVQLHFGPSRIFIRSGVRRSLILESSKLLTCSSCLSSQCFFESRSMLVNDGMGVENAGHA